jgi:hypothetical protein
MSDDPVNPPIEEHNGAPDEVQEEAPRPKDPDEWRLWPPSAKVQIVLIAAGFGLLNFILLAIWALVMMDRFG